MLKAKDIMSRNVISVTKDTPIYEAVELIAKYNFTGVPVVENGMILVGILSEKDCLRLVYDSKDVRNETVEDFMSQPAIYFDENESWLDICDCLMNNFFRRVPVTSKGKLVGIVTRRDIIYEYIRHVEGKQVMVAETSEQ